MRNIIRLLSVDSTNEHAKRLIKKNNAIDGTAILADYQTKGKGQGSHFWVSTKNQNILMSIIMFPDGLSAKKQFQVNIFVSLAIAEYVENQNLQVKIKWPNDIYINHKKVAGILIEHTLSNNKIKHTIAGIGLNLNQQVFPASLPNPVSLKMITGKNYNTEAEASHLLSFLKKKYQSFRSAETKNIKQYLSRLHRYNEYHLYQINHKEIRTKITGIDHYGRLITEDEKSVIRYHNFGEIVFL
jgi:BirA family transcriptional regulator, biotin operon repressor / biotin---[acetyl-CoA-carboxylase] ligase